MLTLKLTKFRNPRNPNLIHLFSSSSSNFNSNNNDENNPTPNQSSPPSLSSHFSNIKSSLKNTTTQNRKFTKPQSPIPLKTNSFEEITKNLSQFRSKTSPPSSLPVNTTPSNTVSFQELYKRNPIEKGGEKMGTSSRSNGNVGGVGGRLSFDAIRESLKNLKPGNHNMNVRVRNDGDSGKVLDPYSLKQFQDSFKMKPGDIGTKKAGGGTSVSPLSMLRKEKDGVSGTTAASGSRTNEFVKYYSHTELGDKLKELRPTDKGKNWFSLEELNERLKKLRENEEKELGSTTGGVSVKDIKEGLEALRHTTEEKKRKATLQTFDIMGHLGGTPNYMLQPPKEQLVEKFFHPDNMSSAEKLKLELKKVRDEFKMSESDCGSSRVQVAQLTTKIKHLSSVLHKKDKHSRKGLQEMVQRRKKLLRYLRRTDWESFCFCLDKLGLRDNPDYKN